MQQLLLLCLGLSRNLTAVGDCHGLAGLTRTGADRLHLLDDIIATLHLAEHYVLAIQPRAQHGRDEEL